MRYSDTLRALNESPRVQWPELLQIGITDPDLRAALPAEPMTFEHQFHETDVTLSGPLADRPPRYASVTILSIDGAEVSLWSQKDILRLLLGMSGHADNPARYLDDTHPLIIEHIARPLLDRLGDALSAEAVVIGAHGPARDRMPEGDCITVSLSGSDFAETHLTLSGPCKTLKIIAPLFKSNDGETEVTPVETAGIEFASYLLAPEFEIAGEDLAALREDDVVLLDHQWLEADTYRLCIADTLVARVSRKGDALHIQSDFEKLKRTDPMTRENPALSDLPVTVSIELARKMLTLEELEAVSVGDVLDFADATLDVVSLTANGREIGKGVLVRSGDQVGLRLTSVS